MPRVRLPSGHPLARIKLAAIDYGSGRVSIVTTDGQIVTARVNVSSEHGLVTRSTFIPAESRMEIIAAGVTFSMTLGTAEEVVELPVVYLDQNHWIDFARWRKSPEGIDAAKRPFFETLAKAADEELVILPLSGAHLTETSKRGGTSRLELASTMLHFSRGWQLRTVLALRRAELRTLFGGVPLSRRDAITLAPEAILDMEADTSIGQELGAELAGLVQRQVWASVLVSLLIDDQPEEDVGRETATRWAQSFAPLAESLRRNAKARARSRDLTRIRFIADLGDDLPAAASESGISPEQFGSWLSDDAEGALSATPGLGRLREVLHMRLVNADDRWESNDLNDWMHLSYAAAYSDLVVGEKKTVNYLRRAEARVSGGAALHRRVSEAYDDLCVLLKDEEASNT